MLCMSLGALGKLFVQNCAKKKSGIECDGLMGCAGRGQRDQGLM